MFKCCTLNIFIKVHSVTTFIYVLKEKLIKEKLCLTVNKNLHLNYKQYLLK